MQSDNDQNGKKRPKEDALESMDEAMEEWKNSFVEVRALFDYNNQYRKENCSEYIMQEVDLKILRTIEFNGHFHSYANLMHEGICKNYPAKETVVREKKKSRDGDEFKFVKTILGLGTHVRSTHKKLSIGYFVEERDVIHLQRNNEIFIKFERCPRCLILVSEYYFDHVRSCSCSHIEAAYRSSFESLYHYRGTPLSVRFEMHVNRICHRNGSGVDAEILRL